MPGNRRAPALSFMAQTRQQPQDHAEQPCAHGVQRSHAGTDAAKSICCKINFVLLRFKKLCYVHNAVKYINCSPVQILVARPEDSGTYVCTARNNEGTTETKVEVIVQGGSQVPSVPRVSVPEPLMVVVEGQTATLRCEVHGNDADV